MRTTTFILLIVATGLFSCKNSSQAMGGEKIDPSAPTKGKHVQELTYDMIISFISKASGISKELKPKIDEAIEAFSKKHSLVINNETLQWGREGEIDYNLMLKNLSTSQKKEFISVIEEIVGSSDMVHLTYNQKSVHKR